jgi:hypothetical protein
LDLREKIEDRIEEIENFYELNFDKPNSQYFEKGRMKLKKLLMYEPSNISEMNVEMNNNKVNMALVVNGTNKNTIESNYNNDINNNINNNGEISFNILNKTIHKNMNENQTKNRKVKFIPLKEKKWKKNRSVEKIKNSSMEKYINNNYNNKKSKNMKNNQIYINKQSNVYINKNYNLYPINKKNNVLNKYINKNQKNSRGKNKSYIEHNYNITKESNSSRSQENIFNIKEYT